MKKIFALMLCACMLMAACAAPVENVLAAEATAAPTPTSVPAEATPTATEAPDDTQAEVEAEAGTAVHAPVYGEQTWIESDANGFSGAIAYPAGFEAMDAALSGWAAQTLQTYETKASAEAEDADGMKAHLYVDYNSYELSNRFVGVKEVGVYAANASGAQESVVYTLNYDAKNEKLLAPEDIVGAQYADAIGALISEKLTEAGKQDLLGDGSALTQNIVITESGLLFLFAEGGDYYECSLPYEQIMDYLVLFSAGPTPTPVVTPAPTANPTVIAEAYSTKDGAHVRASADTAGDTLAGFQGGAVVEGGLMDAGNGFTEIWYNEAAAYVRTSFLSFIDTTPVPEGPEVVAIGFTNAVGVHVRADASTRSKKLATLQFDTELSIVTPYYTDTWHQILFEGKIAYISAKYVNIGKEPTATPAPEQVDPQIVNGPPSIEFVGTCTTNGVIIRSETSTKSDYYGKIYEGAEVQVIESEYRSGWDKVWIPTNHSNTRGYVGYVHSKYIVNMSVVAPLVTSNPVPVIQVTPPPVVTGLPVVGPAIGQGVTIDP